MRSKYLPILISLLVLISAGLYTLKGVEDTTPNFNMGTIQATNLKTQELIDIDTRDFDIIHVFSSWCPVCVEEHPTLVQAQSMHNLKILGLALREEPKQLKTFLSLNSNPYSQVALLNNMQALDIGISKIPTTFVVGDNGKIIYKYIGSLSNGKIKNVILPKLKGKKFPTRP